MDTLFDFDQTPAVDRESLRNRLDYLASRGIRIGTSSWKYQGWIDQIYSSSRYRVRGRFSKRLFEDTCVSEYAATFPTVCGDFAFYQFPSEAMWARLFRQTPPQFQFAFKVPEQITIPRWPVHPRYGALAGFPNPTFLDAGLLADAFLRPLDAYRRQIGVLILEFGTMRQDVDFIAALDPFLAMLPKTWRYAVEVRNSEFLTPKYFGCLRAHNVSHVYNAWTRMPDLGDQIAIPESRTSDLIVVRALLRRGRPYEDAVRKFTPYDRVTEVNASAREGLKTIIKRSLADATSAFLFVNNRLEGNAPGTIASIVGL